MQNSIYKGRQVAEGQGDSLLGDNRVSVGEK